MSCSYCPEGYWVCDSSRPPEGELCGSVNGRPNWQELPGPFYFHAGLNTLWCKPGQCEVKVQSEDPGRPWMEAGVIPLAAGAEGKVFCMVGGGGGGCKVKVEF